MEIYQRHPWDVDLATARQLQTELHQKIEICPLKTPPVIVAGADVSYSRFDENGFAGVVLLRLPELEPVESATVTAKIPFPYIPGYLTFREGPLLLAAFQKLRHTPDVVIFDGQGIAHQRKMGVASHLGLFLNIPTIGCAKSRLVGSYTDPGIERGSWQPLIYKDETVGSVLRTRTNVRPVFVSPGHRIDFADARQVVLQCSKYRLTEPVRQAHLLVNQLRKEA